MGAFFKHKEKNSASEDGCVKFCNVHDIIEESGDGVSVYGTVGFGLYGVDVFVEAKNEEQAKKLIDAENL